MIPLREELAKALSDAVRASSFSDFDSKVPNPTLFSVTPCQDTRFGDYQNSAAMVIAKAYQKPPRQVAEEILKELQKQPQVQHLCDRVEIAGAGFINFHLKNDFVSEYLTSMGRDLAYGGVPQVSKPAKIVIDFSSPNIAKSMHVGHIRSTFLGNALARITRAVGHQVITVNHLGDWGTQFGKLIYGYKNFLNPQALAESPIDEFERLYKEANTLSEKDPNVLQAVRQELAKLQAGDPENLQIWKEISSHSLREFHAIYQFLGILFDHELGESFYHHDLPLIVKETQKLGIAEESQGAICIFFRDDPELANAAPMIIQKADGAFLYATTDLAAARYRFQKWQADQILYVTDARQQLHFKQLRKAVQKWMTAIRLQGQEPWKKEEDFLFSPDQRLLHIKFGSVLGPDRKPIKTRSGDPIKLKDLLDEAQSRTLKIIQEKNPDLSPSEQEAAAKVIGIGALKYADLCQNRDLDYTFDWNKLLSLQGNSAPYLVYAYVRIRSIFRAATEPQPISVPIRLVTPEEISLGKHLIQFGETLLTVLEDYRPHLLTNFLYELAVRFSKFFEACPVLKADVPIRQERLALCDVTARTLKKGLDLLGIQTVEKM